jgi:hypothetical protein
VSSIPSLSTEAPTLLSTPARWDRSMFLSLEASDTRCPPVIDVTGGSRILVHGPYVQLARGLWRAKVSFEICEEAARRKLAVQLGSITDTFTTVDVPPGVPGRHDIEVTHPLQDGDHVEIRIWLKAAAFHGELRFLGATIEPIADAVVAERA